MRVAHQARAILIGFAHLALLVPAWPAAGPDPVSERLSTSAWRFGRTFRMADSKLGSKVAEVIDVARFNGFVAIRYKHAGGTIIGRVDGRTLKGRYYQRNIGGDIEFEFDPELTRAEGTRYVETKRTRGRFRVWLERIGAATYDQPIRSMSDLRFDGPSRFQDTLKDPSIKDLVLYGTRKRNISVLMRYYNTSDSPTATVTHYLALPESDAHQQLLSLKVAPEPAKVHELASGQRVAELHIPPLPPGGCAFGCWSAEVLLSHARVMFDPGKLRAADAVPSELKRKFLAGTRRLALDSPEVTQAAAQCSAGRSTPLDLVRGAHYHVMDALYYKWCRWPSVDKLLRYGHGVCGDYAQAVSALCRKNRVPARGVYGFSAPGSIDEPDFAFGYVDHAWNEVFIPGYGWVHLDSTNNDGKGNRDWTVGYLDTNHIVWKRDTKEERPTGRRTAEPWLHAWKWRWDRYWTKAATVDAAPLAKWSQQVTSARTWAQLATRLDGVNTTTRHALAAALMVRAGEMPAMNAHLAMQGSQARDVRSVVKLLAASAALGNRVAYWFLLAADNGKLSRPARKFWRDAVRSLTEPASWQQLEQRLGRRSTRYACRVVPLEVLEVERDKDSGQYRILALKELPKRSVYEEKRKRFDHDMVVPVNWVWGLATDGKTLYVGERRGGRILRVDPRKGSTTRLQLNGEHPTVLRGMTMAPNGRLWAASDHSILEVDPVTGRAARVHECDKTILGIARARDALYVTYYKEPRVAVLDPGTFHERSSFPVPVTHGRGVRGMAVRGAELWIADTGAQRILVLDRHTGAIRGDLFARYDHYVNDLAFVGDRLYATHSYKNQSRLCYTYFKPLPGPGHATRSALYRVKIRYRGSLRNRSKAPTGEARLVLPTLLQTRRQEVESVQYVGAKPVIVAHPNGDRSAVFERASLASGEEWTCGWDAVATLCSLRYRPTEQNVGTVAEVPRQIGDVFLRDTPLLGLGEESIQKHVRACCPTEPRSALALVRAIRDYVFDRVHLRTLKPDQWRSGAGVLEQGFGSNEEYARAFVALCRARGLPARVCGSYTIPNFPRLRGTVLNQTRSDKYVQIWAEAYLPGVGWVPVGFDGEDRDTGPPHHMRLLFGLTWRYVQLTNGYKPTPSDASEWFLEAAHQVKPGPEGQRVKVRRTETISFAILDELVE